MLRLSLGLRPGWSQWAHLSFLKESPVKINTVGRSRVIQWAIILHFSLGYIFKSILSFVTSTRVWSLLSSGSYTLLLQVSALFLHCIIKEVTPLTFPVKSQPKNMLTVRPSVRRQLAPCVKKNHFLQLPLQHFSLHSESDDNHRQEYENYSLFEAIGGLSHMPQRPRPIYQNHCRMR